MKLCVFQGTFNPIHNAHLRVANFVLEKNNFDKIIFIPAYNPPHKNCDINLSIHRLEMVKLALKNYPNFEVSDIEYKRKGKSYTYLTIKELYEKYENVEKIYFIIGTDAFEHIEKWYESDKLKKLVEFIVFEREKSFKPEKYNYLKSKGYKFEFQTLSFEDISSTNLRNDFEKYKTNIPKEVMEYINEHHLYEN